MTNLDVVGENITQKYSPGYGEKLINDYKTRNVSKEASFFLSYLNSGMRVLDCGCGPGTITTGLAKVVYPGEVVGIDIESEQIEMATEHAKKKRATNLKFKVANVYKVPFSDNYFDAAFLHTILQHLQHPIYALKEVYRVLKPGGIIGVRDDDRGGFIISPSNIHLEKLLNLFNKFMQYHGGNPYIGRDHRRLLRESGFINTKATATCHYHSHTEEIYRYSKLAIELLESTVAKVAIQNNWISHDELNELIQACRMWGKDPDAFDAIIFCETIAWKELNN